MAEVVASNHWTPFLVRLTGRFKSQLRLIGCENRGNNGSTLGTKCLVSTAGPFLAPRIVVTCIVNHAKHAPIEIIIAPRQRKEKGLRSVVDLNNILILLDKKGVGLVSMKESIGATTATGHLMLNVLVSVSQWEREAICERTKEAMSYLKDNQMVYNGPVYGFDSRDGLFYPNVEEQAVIERIK